MVIVASIRPGTAHDLGDLSLEELLAVELDQMALAGLHHTHEKGEWMVGYRFAAMGMDGIRDGSRNRTDGQVLAEGFVVTPTDMTMEMHMFNVMFGVTDEITLMAMVPYVRKSMDHVRMDGLRFTTGSEGPGDLDISVLYSILRNANHRLIGIAGLTLPTGSIDEDDRLPATMTTPSSIQRLPYPMQLGSGSVDVKLGLTYLGQIEGWGWGAHASGLVRTDENKHDYRLGDRYDVTAWGARKVTHWSSASLRLGWTQRFDIVGADPALNPRIVPTADPDLQAGRRLDILLGLNLFQDAGRLEGLRVTAEAGLPVYQRLDGPQLETDWTTSLTIEWTR